jgi:hypothetical protein
MSRPNLSFNIIAANQGFGVRQLAAAFLPASLLAGVPPYAEMTASKLAGVRQLTDRTPKLRPNKKTYPRLE